jgi:phosphatidylethanolamine/phosphatidyl-N-methylethanolamine N-methyltransferase
MLAMSSPYIEFLKAAIKNPLQISTVFQTSRWLRNRMLNHIDFANCKHIMELGPGAGAITEGIAQRLSPNCKFTGFELNEDLVEYLRNYYPPQLEFVVGSAERAKEYAELKGPADAVISSLPWSLFTPDLQQNIVDSIYAALKPGGIFTTYVCINAIIYPGAQNFKYLLHRKFKNVKKTPTEWRNIPPAFVYICEK